MVFPNYKQNQTPLLSKTICNKGCLKIFPPGTDSVHLKEEEGKVSYLESLITISLCCQRRHFEKH